MAWFLSEIAPVGAWAKLEVKGQFVWSAPTEAELAQSVVTSIPELSVVSVETGDWYIVTKPVTVYCKVIRSFSTKEASDRFGRELSRLWNVFNAGADISYSREVSITKETKPDLTGMLSLISLAVIGVVAVYFYSQSKG